MSIDFFGTSCERALEISVSQQSQDHVDFPVLLPTPPSWHPFWSDVSIDGSDIHCVSSTGVAVPHQLVSIDVFNKTIQLYVKLTLSSKAETTVYVLYKGYANTRNIPSSTWSAYYAVYHMDSISGTEPDALGSFDGTVVGADVDQPGQIGQSMLFSASDLQDRVTNASAGNWERSQGWIVSAYAKPLTAAAMTVASKYEPVTDARGWSTGFTDSGSNVVANMIISYDNDPATRVHVQTLESFSVGSWMHVAYSYSGSSLASGCSIYVNGNGKTLVINNDNLGWTTILNSAIFAVGAQFGSSYQASWFDGYLDEVRIMTVKAGDQWIESEYNNLSNPSTFSSIVATHNRTLHRCCPQPMNLAVGGFSTRYHPAHSVLLSTQGWAGSPGTTVSGFVS